MLHGGAKTVYSVHNTEGADGTERTDFEGYPLVTVPSVTFRGLRVVECANRLRTRRGAPFGGPGISIWASSNCNERPTGPQRCRGILCRLYLTEWSDSDETPQSRNGSIGICIFMSSLTAAPALAQNWSFDARRIAIGGVGSTSNVAVDMVDEQRPYRAIVLPFGLFQILPNMPKLDPTSDEFDLVRAIEYAASPIHFIIGRDDTNTASAFITDLRNGELSRDLNVYRGFSPATSVAAEGLASPNWGYTFKFRKRPERSVSRHLRGRRASTSR